MEAHQKPTPPASAEDVLAQIKTVLLCAEVMSADQQLPETQICMAALKDIRRLVKNT